MDFLIDITKYTRYKVYKTALIISGFVLLACVVISCNGGKNKSANPDTPKVTPQASEVKADTAITAPPTIPLYILYLSKKELQGLLTNANNDNVVVLQFFFDADGNLDLHSWPRYNGGFSTDVPLNVDKVSCTSITLQNVNLGNITLTATEYGKLLDKSTKYGFFVFVPKLSPYKYVVYDIYGENSIPTSCNYPPYETRAPVPVKKPITSTNPSPPG